MEELIRQIEVKRTAFLQLYKKYRNVNAALMAIFIIAFIPVMIWVMPIKDYGTYISLGIILVFVVVLFIYGNQMKKKTSKATITYIDDYCKLVDQYVFWGEEVEDYYQFTDEQIGLTVIQEAQMIKDLTDVNSRNVVRYRLGETTFESADVVAYIHEQVKRRTLKKGVFYGKILVADNQQKHDERTLIYLKPKIELPSYALGPTDLEGLTKKHEDQDFALYSTSDKIEKVLTKKALNFLTKFPINQNLIDLTISIKKGKTYFALSLSEAIMVIPYQAPANKEALEHLKSAIKACEEFLEFQK